MIIITNKERYDFFHSIRTGDQKTVYDTVHRDEIEVPEKFYPALTNGDALFVNGELYLHLRLNSVLHCTTKDGVPLYSSFKEPVSGWVNLKQVHPSVKAKIRQRVMSSMGLYGRHVPLLNPSQELIDEFSRFAGQPIFMVRLKEMYKGDYYSGMKTVIEKEVPILSTLKFINLQPSCTYFLGMEDPLKFYVETESYISAVINKQDIADTRSDEIKIEAHGFDKKKSFRNVK